jgi:uncharacterized protein YdhG (YjbR/CyaY superfamily)
MGASPRVPKDIDEYIAGYPKDVQAILQRVRRTIRKAAPGVEETIKYEIPTYTLKGNLISFGAFKSHIGIYPVPAGTKEFQKELAPYRAQKSSVRIPLDKPIPYDLISRLVKFRLEEHLARLKAKGP